MSIMSATSFIERQIAQIRQGGCAVLFRKMKWILLIPLNLPLGIFAIPVVVVVRLIKPWLLVRCGALGSSRIGDFAAITEMYLCEQDAGINMPRQRHVDIFFMVRPISNQQLAKMWKRILRVWPAWILSPIHHVNWLIPGGAVHEIDNSTQGDRDVHNLLDRFPSHLKFTAEEEARGKAGLRMMGIPTGTSFVCLIVRDSAYLNAHIPTNAWSYHSYRDCDIQNYVLAAEELADRGYFVIRMGAKVREAIKSGHPRVIDYATNGMRSDFMDIYLGAKCEFCISNGTGFDAVPNIFRRPIVYVDHVALVAINTWSPRFLATTKKHWLRGESRFMTFREIFESGAAYFGLSSQYEDVGIDLIESTPEEIASVVLEMEARLKDTWQSTEEDEALQHCFWEIFPKYVTYNSRSLHGEIRSRIGADFLRQNKAWLE